MEIPAIHGWNMPLVGENRDEMYGGIYGSSCHPWISLPSMDGRGPPVECITYSILCHTCMQQNQIYQLCSKNVHMNVRSNAPVVFLPLTLKVIRWTKRLIFGGSPDKTGGLTPHTYQAFPERLSRRLLAATRPA